MKYRDLLPVLLASALGIALLPGCDCGGGMLTPSTPCTTTTQCRAGMLCIDGHCRASTDTGPSRTDTGPARSDAGHRTPVSVTITPAMATLTSTDGSQPTQVFTAHIVYDDGSMGAAGATNWVLDARTIGDIDMTGGTFVANGVVGGSATVTVTASAGAGLLMATATVHVAIVRNLIAPGVPATVAAMFGSATPVTDPARDSQLVYPLDQALMPQNVYPADLQWTRGNVGDLVRIMMTKTDVTTNAYVLDDAPHHWLADAAMWRSLAQTDPMEAASIHVDHIDAASGNLIMGAPVHVTFARAALTGSVYYWAIAQGRIIRIDDGTANRVDFMPHPEQGCVGCHSVSPSGRYMVGRFGGGDNVGSVFDLTTDLSASPAPSVWASRTSLWWFSSWSPDESRLVVTFNESGIPGQGGAQLRFLNPTTGSFIDPPGMPVGSLPAWSPDGSRIAYVTNLPAHSWGGDFRTGDIALLPVTGTDRVGAPTIIHRGNSIPATSLPAGAGDSYPSWSPDSHLIAFAHGTGCRSALDGAGNPLDRDALYLMREDGSAVVRLDAASGGPTGDLSYQPRFSPFTQGGYFWVAFLSNRPYGNRQVGTLASPHEQIWVTAISTTPTAGMDPSRVAYWLPGQDPTSLNISAYWAPRACRMDGTSCTVGSECCGGLCAPNAMGMLVCTPPPVAMCHHADATCSTDADCCMSATEHLACIGHVCVNPIM